MKRSSIYVVLLVLSAGLCSCKMTSTLRSAKVIDIQSDITQMPTVVDLVVDTNYVKNDTTWTNTTFKEHHTKTNMRNVLIGEILEETKADVLVQPQTVETVTHHNPFKSTHTLAVKGYPARYRNFRTASEEDLRILNGVDPQPVNYNTIYIGTGGLPNKFADSPLTKMIAKPTAKDKKVKKKKEAYLRNDRIFSVAGGYNGFFMFDSSEDFLFSGFGVEALALWKTGKKIYLGAGIGLDGAWGQMDEDEEDSEWVVPVYFNSRFYLSQTRVAPYFDLRAGGAMWIEKYYNTKWNEKDTNVFFGPYIGAYFGVAFGRHVTASIGTDGAYCFGKDGGARAPSLALKVGACF